MTRDIALGILMILASVAAGFVVGWLGWAR